MNRKDITQITTYPEEMHNGKRVIITTPATFYRTDWQGVVGRVVNIITPAGKPVGTLVDLEMEGNLLVGYVRMFQHATFRGR